MNQTEKETLTKRLKLILSHIEKPTLYKYHDILNDIKVEFKDLQNFPDIFSLLLQDRELRYKYKDKDGNYHVSKNQLSIEVDKFIVQCNLSWPFFTQDGCYPIPLKENVSESYIPLFGWYKNKDTFYIKAKPMCVSYIKHILSNLSN